MIDRFGNIHCAVSPPNKALSGFGENTPNRLGEVAFSCLIGKNGAVGSCALKLRWVGKKINPMCYGGAASCTSVFDIRKRITDPSRRKFWIRILRPKCYHLPCTIHRSGSSDQQYSSRNARFGSGDQLGDISFCHRTLVRCRRSTQAISGRYPAGLFLLLGPLRISNQLLYAARIAADNGNRGRSVDAHLSGDPDRRIIPDATRTQCRVCAERIRLIAWRRHCAAGAGSARGMVQLADSILYRRHPGNTLRAGRHAICARAANWACRKAAGHSEGGLAVFFRERNIWLCAGIACLMVSWLMLHQNFLPLFLTTVRGLSNRQMSR